MKAEGNRVITYMVRILTVIWAWISCFLPCLPITRHVSSSTLALSTWNLSWVLGNTCSRVLISAFSVSRQAIPSPSSSLWWKMWNGQFKNDLSPIHHKSTTATSTTQPSWGSRCPRHAQSSAAARPWQQLTAQGLSARPVTIAAHCARIVTNLLNFRHI